MPIRRPAIPTWRAGFVAFDLLYAAGKDSRHDRLIDRKHELRRIIGAGLPPIMYADDVEGTGVALFDKVCALDLEGIVAKYQYAEKLRLTTAIQPSTTITFIRPRKQNPQGWKSKGYVSSQSTTCDIYGTQHIRDVNGHLLNCRERVDVHRGEMVVVPV